jgi:hypothetical protein
VRGLVPERFGIIDLRAGGLAAPSFGLALALAGWLCGEGWPSRPVDLRSVLRIIFKVLLHVFGLDAARNQAHSEVQDCLAVVP